MKKEYTEEEIYEYMFTSLGKFGPLSMELRAAIIAMTEIVYFKKREMILKKGDVNRFCYFSFHGLVKGFFEAKGKTITEWFMDRGDIFIWPTSFFDHIPSVGSIAAVEAMTTVQLPYENYKFLKLNFPDFALIDDLATKYYYGKTYERIEMKAYTAKENYTKLLKTHPQIIERATVDAVATYLGTTRETLSKIRKKLQKM